MHYSNYNLLLFYKYINKNTKITKIGVVNTEFIESKIVFYTVKDKP